MQPVAPASPLAFADTDASGGSGSGGGLAEQLLARMERSIASTGGSIDQLKVPRGRRWVWVWARVYGCVWVGGCMLFVCGVHHC